MKNDRSNTYGFKCLVIGYDWITSGNGLKNLEIELSFLGGACSASLMKKNLVLPPVSGGYMRNYYYHTFRFEWNPMNFLYFTPSCVCSQRRKYRTTSRQCKKQRSGYSPYIRSYSDEDSLYHRRQRYRKPSTVFFPSGKFLKLMKKPKTKTKSIDSIRLGKNG